MESDRSRSEGIHQGIKMTLLRKKNVDNYDKDVKICIDLFRQSVSTFLVQYYPVK